MLAQLPLPMPPPLVPPAPSPNPLPVPFLPQDETLWCWAACAAMVLAYYRNPVRQCDIASFRFHQDACTASINFNEGIDATLFPSIYDHFGISISPPQGPVDSGTLAGEITDGRPVQVGLVDGGNNGHVVLVYGFDSGSGFFVHDPDAQKDTASIPFTTLQTGMRLGIWRATWINIQPK
jgi:ABC-type bacteriocin/lantibiotic exporter with double-glycine peptidase domain